MPKTKRAKTIPLTETEKKGKILKKTTINKVRDATDEFSYLYVFEIHNQNSTSMANIRKEWKEKSRFFFGKNKVVGVALGTSPEDEVKENIHLVTDSLNGNCGVLFTNESESKVLKFFRDFAEPWYASSGYVATETIVIPKGVLPQFRASQEPYLRLDLHVPVTLNAGVVSLDHDWTACKAGEALTPEQAKFLRMLDRKTAKFHFTLRCVWAKGKFKQFQK